MLDVLWKVLFVKNLDSLLFLVKATILNSYSVKLSGGVLINHYLINLHLMVTMLFV